MGTRSERVHARCGRPWDEHRTVMVGEWFAAPRCDDEGDHPTAPGDDDGRAPK